MIAGLIVLVGFSLVVSGCNLFGDKVSKKERIDMFVADINAHNWTSLYTHIHPDNSSRNNLKSATDWEPSPFAANVALSYSNYQESGDTITVDITSSDSNEGSTWTFTMKEDTPDLWYIDRLTTTRSAVSPIIQ